MALRHIFSRNNFEWVFFFSSTLTIGSLFLLYQLFQCFLNRLVLISSSLPPPPPPPPFSLSLSISLCICLSLSFYLSSSLTHLSIPFSLLYFSIIFPLLSLSHALSLQLFFAVSGSEVCPHTFLSGNLTSHKPERKQTTKETKTLSTALIFFDFVGPNIPCGTRNTRVTPQQLQTTTEEKAYENEHSGGHCRKCHTGHNNSFAERAYMRNKKELCFAVSKK